MTEKFLFLLMTEFFDQVKKNEPRVIFLLDQFSDIFKKLDPNFSNLEEKALFQK